MRRKLSFDKICTLIQIGLAVLSLFISGYAITKVIEVQNSFNQYHQDYLYMKEEISNETENVESDILMKNENGDNIAVHDERTIDNSIEQNITNNAYSYDENTSRETLLKYAQNAFLAGNYQETVQIYSMEKLQNDPVVNNNLGYMYAKGYYFYESFEKANEYYDKAIEGGCEEARGNKLALYIRIHSIKSLYIIRQECERDNEQIIDYFLSFYDEYESDNYQEKKKFVINTIDDLVMEEWYDFMLSTFYVWEEVGLVKMSEVPTNTDFEYYEFIRFMDEDYVTKILYKKYINQCINIQMLETGFLVNKD